MKFNFFKCVTIIVFFLGISACSRVKGYFPDKSKDYQLTSEIPELNVPSDLSDNAIQAKSEANGIHSEYTNSEFINSNAIDSNQMESESVEMVVEEKAPAVYVELVEFSGGATRIRVEDSMERIWRFVGKALSRHSIEIIDRNELDRVYFVQYDANFKKIEDDSIWDEIVFIFGSDPAREEEFRIKLVEYGGFIEVIVLNKNDIPLSKGNGFKLLNTLYKTIKQDLAE